MLTTVIIAAIIGLVAFMLIPSKKSNGVSQPSPIESQVAAMFSSPSINTVDLNEKLSMVDSLVREKHLAKRKREALEELKSLLKDD
jgi:hypothetical protein